MKAATTTCPFAQNVFYEYWSAARAGGAESIRAYSPAAARWFKLDCNGRSKARCVADDGSEVRFGLGAVKNYTMARGAAYAAGHTVSSHRSIAASAETPPATTRNQDGGGRGTSRVCLPTVRLPAVHIPTTRIPAVTLPAYTDYDGVRHSAQRLPGQTIPGSTIPGRTLKGGCLEVPRDFSPRSTTVLTSGYDRLDADYSDKLTTRYWDRAGRGSLVPDYSASGFGELNGAGYPKNQYVRPYVRRDGTSVSGYWRNSPTDGLPTCHIISC